MAMRRSCHVSSSTSGAQPTEAECRFRFGTRATSTGRYPSTGQAAASSWSRPTTARSSSASSAASAFDSRHATASSTSRWRAGRRPTRPTRSIGLAPGSSAKCGGAFSSAGSRSVSDSAIAAPPSAWVLGSGEASPSTPSSRERSGSGYGCSIIAPSRHGRAHV